LATLLVRPRGWHLDEAHVVVNNKVASGSLFDFGMYFYHNVHNLVKGGSAPYFYLPKLEHYHEARLWNDVFVASQKYMGVPQGTIRATILLETITAAFQMEEILYEIREHSIGLNCGRWDYLFSYIKKLREVQAGHDGTWVAHPALVGIARDVFDEHMKTKNQIGKVPTEGANITEEQLLEL
ncbi:hypothetical protein TrRE_jg1093, partial [Triparma retinervis]